MTCHADLRTVHAIADLLVHSADTRLSECGHWPQELLKAEDSPFTEALLEGTYDVLTQRGPLHCAARLGRLPQLELLLEAGALVDCLDGNGWTALQVRPDTDTQKAYTSCSVRGQPVLIPAVGVTRFPLCAWLIADPEPCGAEMVKEHVCMHIITCHAGLSPAP